MAVNSTNRLAKEKSPYLLQHAANPVDWYAWSQEAFDAARRDDKPVFLSIGYSTCHWCHVMEEESFESEMIAKYLNDHFVSIKVDREERPDVDQIYMSAVQAITGTGGWPLSVFLTADRQPFFGGTYFPAYAKWGSPGFLDVLASITHSWKDDRDKLLNSGHTLTSLLSRNLPGQGGDEDLSPDILLSACEDFSKSFDSRYGGFGHAPKFPSPHNLSFLLRYGHIKKDRAACDMAELTLRKMGAGGVYDHLGGGFHRYATDRQWQVPHFEKMLYDQAMLARVYTDMYQLSKDLFFASIAKSTLNYCLRDLRDSDGAFYSAEDADSADPYGISSANGETRPIVKKREGAYYLWSAAELRQILEPDDIQIFEYYYGIQPDGNAVSDPHGEFHGRNVLAEAHDITTTARECRVDEQTVVTRLCHARERLLAVREGRPRPHRDDKILTDWNGLMISALAVGGRVLGFDLYVEAARKAADFILDQLVKDGELLHRYRDGEAAIPGMLDDYAFFINALLDLYEVTFDVLYIEKAAEWQERMNTLFADDQGGGYFLTPRGSADLIYRPRESYDGALPSGNSMAAFVLVRLYRMTLNRTYFDRAQTLFRAFAPQIRQRPSVHTHMLSAFAFAVGPSFEIVTAGPQEEHKLDAMVNAVYQTFLPHRVLLHRPDRRDLRQRMEAMCPHLEHHPVVGNGPTAYICQDSVCQQPTNNIREMQTILDDADSWSK